jgi:hypothetical protein
MKTHVLPFLALVLLFSLSSCFTPRSVIRVEPSSDQVRWDYGQAIVETTADSLIGKAAFIGATKEYLVFNIEVENRGNNNVLVSPEQFYLTNPNGNRFFAIDPEKQMLGMEIEESRREASAKNTAVVVGVVAVAAVTAAVVASSRSSSSRNERTYSNTYSNNNWWFAPNIMLGNYSGSSSVSRPPASSWSNTQERRYWSEQTLRRTTVGPDQFVRGQVLFPRQDMLQTFLLIVPAEQSVMSFGFKQKIFKPTNNY